LSFASPTARRGRETGASSRHLLLQTASPRKPAVACVADTGRLLCERQRERSIWHRHGLRCGRQATCLAAKVPDARCSRLLDNCLIAGAACSAEPEL
jgi:hypothetical protein